MATILRIGSNSEREHFKHMRESPNKTYTNQNKKLIPQTSRKAIVTATYPNNYTVDVYFIGNNQTVIRNIPIASNVDITKVAQGDRCKIDMFDETNPNDMVMAYTYGKPQKKMFASGSAAVATTATTIPHGLGVVPDVVVFIPRMASATGSVYESTNADATNIYLTFSAAMGTLTVDWYVIIF